MITTDDLDACFLTDDFAQRAAFTVGASRVDVNGYFTDASDAADMYGVQIEAVDPTFTAPTSELAVVPNRAAVAVYGPARPLVHNGRAIVYRAVPIVAEGSPAAYTVQRIQKTGTGVSVCYLKPTV